MEIIKSAVMERLNFLKIESVGNEWHIFRKSNQSGFQHKKLNQTWNTLVQIDGFRLRAR